MRELAESEEELLLEEEEEEDDDDDDDEVFPSERGVVRCGGGLSKNG